MVCVNHLMAARNFVLAVEINSAMVWQEVIALLQMPL